MINQLTVMLYVKDVNETADFWQTYLGFTQLQKIDLGTSFTIILGNERHFSIQLFQIDFIQAVSPEVSLETPSLMFHVEDLTALNQKLKSSGFFVSEISQHGEQLSFNFADNEGRYFACTEK